MSNHAVNWLAVLAAGISSFLLGGLWYSQALFGKPWMQENRLSPETLRQSNKARVFGWSLVLSLIMAVTLAMFLNDPSIQWSLGLLYGCLAGVWICCGIAIVALFEQKSLRYILINGGYMILALSLMGIILGAWK